MSDRSPEPGAPLDGRRIIVGITGGIAAYKTPMLVRRLRDAGADVQVVLTASAAKFVTRTTMQAVSGRPVRDDLWDELAEASMGHIELARWADLLLVAPATADFLSRLASGRADDLLTTLRLATRAPVVLVPAMNHVMWAHPATQRNVRALEADGCRMVAPDVGPQACGEFGPGRMPEPEALCRTAIELLGGQAAGTGGDRGPGARHALAGLDVLITAGPTREAIDPVRFISNHSSGKQGYALATAAAEAGARVTLISGPVNLPAPVGVERVDVVSAEEMLAAVMSRVARCDIFIGVAAVADYRPAAAAAQKIKKRAEGPATMTLALVENPDIVATVGRRSVRPFVVGFAAETHDALEHAREKRRRKGIDLIVVNDVSRPDIGFESERNEVTVIWEGGEERLPPGNKLDVARAILDRVAARCSERAAMARHESVAE
jgi:phosphopantothenoylcysteine decarboxylase / phosphopantothenate---cysteine ligase